MPRHSTGLRPGGATGTCQWFPVAPPSVRSGDAGRVARPVAHPIVLAGHYNLYCSCGKNEGENEGRPRITKQEIAAFLVSVVLVLVGS